MFEFQLLNDNDLEAGIEKLFTISLCVHMNVDQNSCTYMNLDYKIIFRFL